LPNAPVNMMNQRYVSAVRTLQLWLWAAAAGVAAAAATVGFRWLIMQVEWLSTGQTGGLVEAARAISPWHRWAVGAAGGVLAGLVLYVGQRWAQRGPDGAVHVDYMDAARKGHFVLNDRTTLTRSVSSLLSVGTGASIGREGPMVQLAAWLASWVAWFSPLSAVERNAILVCAIAAGIGSAYRAPVAGVVFVLELALGFFASHTIAPVMIASAVSSGLIHWLVAPQALYTMPMVSLLPTSLEAGLVLGLLAGFMGWGLLESLEISRRAFSRIHALPLRLGLGGVLVGAISAAVPEAWGNGYSVVSEVLQGDLTWKWVALLLLMKLLATLLSAGSGAVGGIFTPTLFVGATSGYVLGHLASVFLPLSMVGDPRVMAVIGMGAVLAAVTQAPLMAIVMVLEMTQQFQLTVPVMLACGVACAISMQLGARPLYGNPIEGHQ
jgi:chloride channel protein, CIC family